MELPLPSSAAAPWLAPALWLVARGTVLLALAALAALALRRGSAATRHMVWALALGTMLALPAASLLIPQWELPFVHLVALDGPAAAPVPGTGGGRAGTDWSTVVLAVWALGAAVALARYGVAMVSVRLVARGARQVTRGEWMERLQGAGRELGMRERVRLLRADGAAMPMTWGILHPAVLVPADADGWTAERKRVVLLHELAHVARRDCLWQSLASLCCAAYWFHPGVWWAARQMRIEREQACDDRVLGAGTRASEYAGHLLEVARSFRPRPLTSAAAVAMAARRSQLEGRVVAVLDAARDRAAVPGRAALVAGGIAAVALFPLAAASPEGFEPAAPPVVSVKPVAATPPPSRIQWTVEPASARGEGGVSVPLVAAGDLHLNGRVKKPSAQAATAPARDERRFPSFGPPDEPILMALIHATRDSDPEVRRNAVSALGRLDGVAVVGPLVASINDSDARVRSAAAMALGEYVGRQGQQQAAGTGRVAATPQCEGDRCAAERPRTPAGSAVPPAPRPRSARTDLDASAGPNDPALRILGGLMEEDTLSGHEIAPGIHGDEMR